MSVDQPIAFIAGCFDGAGGPHPGHIYLLQRAKSLVPGDTYLVVAINNDAYLARKGPGRPLMDYEQRRAALYETGLVDEVFPIEDSPLDIIKMLQPAFIVVGDDYTVDRVVGAQECEAWGGKVVIVPRIPGHSTTNQIAGRVISTTPCHADSFKQIEIDV